MSTEATMHVLDRSMRDDAFLDRFRAAPEAALGEFDLTDDEVAALAAGDEERIRGHLDTSAIKTAVAVIVIT